MSVVGQELSRLKLILGGLGDEELAPPARTDRILHHLARSRRHELDAVRALLPVIWMVLIFGGVMGDFRLREQVLRHGVRRDDGPRNQRYALQQRTTTNAFVYRAGWICHASSPYIAQNKARFA